MSASLCAVCGSHDPLGTGLCTACADDGGPRALLFLNPVDALSRDAVAQRLRGWAGPRARASALGEVIRGRQPLLRLPDAVSRPAVGRLAAEGISVRAVQAERWYRALPASFLVMVLSVLATGAFASARGLPTLLIAAAAVALVLLWGARVQLTRPAFGAPRSPAQLPATTRAALAAALAKLPEGPARGLVVELARVGEATYASLPLPFRTSALGEAVVALLDEVGPLGLETARLQAIATGRGGRPVSTDGAALHAALQKRLRLLDQTVDVLTRIARHGAESDETAVVEASALLGEVRAEAERRVLAEAEVNALLER